MIGWKADYGISIQDTLADLSQITWYDADSYFCIPQHSKIEAVDTEYTSPGAVAASLESIFGAEYYRLFPIPNWTEQSTYKMFNLVAPSTTKIAPNTLENMSGEQSKGVCCYIKSLNRLLQKGPHNTYYTRIYEVSGTSLKLLPAGTSDKANWASQFNTIYTSAEIRVPILTKYDEISDLTKSENYQSLYIHVKTPSNTAKYRIYEPSSGNTEVQNNVFLYSLFGSATVPDIEIGDSSNPYEPGGDSQEGDLPPGTFDNTSDPIPDSSLPTLSSADTGFTRIYNPTLSQVQALARYLWTEPSIIDTIWNHIKQFFEDPMQAIIGFNLVPCRVPDGGTRSFALMFIDTGVQMNTAANQFVDVDCGTLELNRYYGSALDQNPYTKVSCYLPYIGTVHLNTDEVMGTTLQVKYRIDIVSGICVAKIFVDGSVLYQYSGHCAITIPISSADFSSYVSAAITVGTAVAGMAVGAGVGSAIEASAVASPSSIAPVEMTGNAEADLRLLNKDLARREKETKRQAATFSGLAEQSVSNTVGQVMSGKMQVEHSGSFSGNSGYLGVRRPYLIIERPNMCLPASYGSLNGYPSMITLSLKDCTGFTRVQQVQLTGCTATNSEQSEILQFLKSGVIL